MTTAQWPKGGCIMAVRSSDNGQSWTKPVVVIDTDQDDRDPSVACLKDGTLLLNWFTLHQNRVAIWLARSTDQGKTWSKPVKLKLDSPYSFACSAPVRKLPDGSLILGLYCEDKKAKRPFGATVTSIEGFSSGVFPASSGANTRRRSATSGREMTGPSRWTMARVASTTGNPLATTDLSFRNIRIADLPKAAKP
jgi:hypothetical protein